MSRPDATSIAALQEAFVRPVFFAYLDFVGDPVRANTSGYNITPAATGDPDLDGHEFSGISHEFTSVDPVCYRSGGTETITATISGIPGLDTDMLSLIENSANWRGREARLWKVIYDASQTQRGGYHDYYTGQMTQIKHSGSAEGQAITVTIEDYLAIYAKARNRTYLSQEKYDAGDLSAKAAIAIANGNYTGALVEQPTFGGFNIGDFSGARFF